MHKHLLLAATVLFAAQAFAAPPLFPTPSETKWTVTKGGAAAGSITLLTSSAATRAEYRASAKAPVVIFLGNSGKVWVREAGGDIELAEYKGGVEASLVPALLLPVTTATKDKADAKDGKVTAYAYGNAKATYKHDAKGPSSVDVVTGGATYTLTRTTHSTSTADASNFTVRPKKGSASRLAKLSGNLLGPSDSNVSATAGTRGAGTKGLKLADGGNYKAVEELENRDAKWRAKLDSALEDFQKEGKVGKGRDE
ncbi:MAG TPA: hypothetical protein VF618_28045 [Thermoanaerobaculia bacterium]